MVLAASAPRSAAAIAGTVDQDRKRPWNDLTLDTFALCVVPQKNHSCWALVTPWWFQRTADPKSASPLQGHRPVATTGLDTPGDAATPGVVKRGCGT